MSWQYHDWHFSSRPRDIFSARLLRYRFPYPPRLALRLLTSRLHFLSLSQLSLSCKVKSRKQSRQSKRYIKHNVTHSDFLEFGEECQEGEYCRKVVGVWQVSLWNLLAVTLPLINMQDPPESPSWRFSILYDITPPSLSIFALDCATS